MKDCDEIIIASSDSSSDEDDVVVTHSKKVARRGLNLPVCFTDLECKTNYPSYAIYSSKILKLKEQRRNEFLHPIDVVDLREDDIDLCGPVRKERKQSGDDSSNTENVNHHADVLDQTRNSPSPPPEAPRVAKRLPRKTMKLLSCIEKNRILYTASKQQVTPESSLLPENDLLNTTTTRTIPAKFRWQGSIFRIEMRRNEQFVSVLPKIAEKCQAPLSAILLTRNEETIQAVDSPSSVGLSSADIIDCYLLNSLSNTKDHITLVIQSNDCKEKISISLNQFSPLSELMEEYAKQRNLPLSKMKFTFDGDTIKATDTPNDLDMENENRIDVIVYKDV